MMESEQIARVSAQAALDVHASASRSFPAGRLLLVSAHNKPALAARLEQLTGVIDHGGWGIEDLAFTLALGRKTFPYRGAIVLPETGSFADIIRTNDSPQVLRGQAKTDRAEVVMMFPGQGSQFLGMGRQLYQASHQYRTIFDQCEELVRPRLNVSLRDLLLKSAGRDGSVRANHLTQTAIAQPALFIVEYALARLLIDYGARPRALLGHSIGEYAAACLAGVFSLEAALEVVCERGRLMQSMPPGSMLAIKAEPSQVQKFLVNGADLAAHNAPGLSVVSGPTDIIESIASRASGDGFETRALHTSHAFHSRMMDPILEAFERVIEKTGPRAPQLPLISTMTGQLLTDAEAISSSYWAQQLRQPVQFAAAAATASTSKNDVLLEVGPGVSLIAFVAQNKDLTHRPRKLVETLGHAKSDASSADALLKTLGQLWIENVTLDLEALYGAEERKLLRLPTYPYLRKRHSITAPPAAGASHASQDDVESLRYSQVVRSVPADAAPAAEEQVLLQLSQLLEARLGRSISEEELDLKLLELGFDSLALSQLAGKLKQTFNILVPVRQLFDSLGTPRSLALHLATNTSAVHPSKPPAKPNNSVPPAGEALRAEVSALSHSIALSQAGAGHFADSSIAAQLAEIAERLSRIEAVVSDLGVGAAHQPPAPEDFAPPGFGDGSMVRPLTQSQREIWVATRIGGAEASIAYNECRAFLFAGKLDVEALELAIRELCQRHAALRLTFSEDGDHCVTHPGINFQLLQIDLRSIDHGTGSKTPFLSALRHQVETPFNLEAGPLFRGSLVQLQDEEHVLVLCAHHIAIDGSSWEILIRELSEIYSAHVEGRSAQLGQAVAFSQYAELEERYSDSHQARADSTFWLAHLKGQTEDLNLPTDRPRPAQRTYAATRSDQHLTPELVTKVRAAAARASCTVQTFLFSAFQILLHRLTGQLDIICGVPTSGQAAAGLDPLMGHCVHVLPLRFLMESNRNVADHLRYVHELMLDGLEHQRATFSELLPHLDRPRDASRPALIQVAFGMGRSQKRPRFAGVETALRVVPRLSETFELYVYVTEDQKGLEVSWSYNTDLFEQATIEQWQRCFTTIITEMSTGSLQQPLGLLQLLSDEDRTRILLAARGPVVEKPSYVPVSDAIAQQTVAKPEHTAVIDMAGPHSYAQLDRRANQIAHFLLGRNLRKNGLVAVCLPRRTDLLATLLGIWRAGLAYVPLDPDYPIDRLRSILEDSGAVALLTCRDLTDRVPPGFSATYMEDVEASILAQAVHVPALHSGPDDLAYVIFTSGSTGRPKGVQISQGAFANFIDSMRKSPGFSQTDTLLALTTISFDIAGLELFLPLVCGGTVVMATRNQALNPKEIERLLSHNAATVLQATPATWQMLFESGWPGQKDLKVLCGGEAFPRHLAEKFLASCGAVWNVYGPTETTVWSTAKLVTNAADLSIGRPIDNTTCYVLDEHQNLVPQGVHGELWIGGKGVALGYLGQPDLTEERFIPDPFQAQERIYRTGDLARLRTDGELECLGRVDFQVKIRGFRIELGEVETAMLQFPNVKACVAAAREDHPGEKTLAGYVVPQEGTHVEPERLRAFLLNKLPAYMVPSAYCVLETLPTTPNNKVDRKALPAPRAPRPVVQSAEPRDEIEREVLSIWAEILKHPSLGPKDNFYAAGGQSLMAIRLIEQINRKFGIELAVNELFNSPTAEGVSDLVRPLVATGGKAPVANHAPTVDEPSPTSSRSRVHRGLFLIQEGDGRTIPIFLVHGDKANSLLPPRLSPGQELWGYHHQGSDGERIQFTTVEDLARHCHQEWVARHGRRPCIVAGHSFGALVAYHIGVLRERDGLPTPRLVIIDARHPDALNSRQKVVGPRTFKRRWDAARHRTEVVRAVRRAIEHLDRGEVVPIDLRTDYILGTYQLATMEYHPPPFYGMVEVLRSREWTLRSPVDLWERAARASVRRVVLEGSHMSFVRDPEGIALIAEQLRRISNEALISEG